MQTKFLFLSIIIGAILMFTGCWTQKRLQGSQELETVIVSDNPETGTFVNGKRIHPLDNNGKRKRVSIEPNIPDGPLSGPVYVAPKSDAKWNLVFQEDFNGTEVDRSEWSMYDGPGHAGNGIRSPQAYTVKDGMLVVTAQMINNNIVSGGMAHRRNYKYGKFEFRVRCEADPSGATSGVVLTWPQSERFPVDGENDIFETLTNPTREPMHTFIHFGPENSQYHKAFKGINGTEWAVWAMEWFEDAIFIFIDGELLWTLTDTDAIPHNPHHLCIQLDAFKTKMGDPVKMYVDWVKIYQVSQ